MIGRGRLASPLRPRSGGRLHVAGRGVASQDLGKLVDGEGNVAGCHQPDLPADPGIGEGGGIGDFDPVPERLQQQEREPRNTPSGNAPTAVRRSSSNHASPPR